MPQLKKAKTKKQMKKSINNLYEALQKEKLHHKKATAHCAHMKQSLAIQAGVMIAMTEEIGALNKELAYEHTYSDNASSAAADIISKLR